jgi:hypothetical protein
MTEPTQTEAITIQPIESSEEDQPEEDEELIQQHAPPPVEEIRRDKRGHRITQKKIQTARNAAAVSIKRRNELKEKAQRYDELTRLGSIDYDKLSEMVASRLIVKEVPKPSEITPAPPAQLPREPERERVNYRQPRAQFNF